MIQFDLMGLKTIIYLLHKIILCSSTHERQNYILFCYLYLLLLVFMEKKNNNNKTATATLIMLYYNYYTWFIFWMQPRARAHKRTPFKIVFWQHGYDWTARCEAAAAQKQSAVRRENGSGWNCCCLLLHHHEREGETEKAGEIHTHLSLQTWPHIGSTT